MPYMKMSNTRYTLICFGFFLVIQLFTYLNLISYELAYGQSKKSSVIEWMLLIATFIAMIGCFILPLIIYIVPGYLYYRCFSFFTINEYYQIPGTTRTFHKKYFGLAFVVLGLLSSITYVVTLSNLALYDMTL
mmetsp:Transcript_33309/g.24465  ORF Transcript_33309/g.24465 Transcript_33309/m.24465 type:complete len:133 (-) Transcript_33309:37-435(-)